MISAKELNPHSHPTTPEQAANLACLLTKINIIRASWGKPMIVTSGLRTWEEHVEIYKKKLGADYSEDKAPKESKHLIGAAVDISDPEGTLYDWLSERTGVLRGCGLYCELGTKGWVHFQILPPASGNTWFLP